MEHPPILIIRACHLRRHTQDPHNSKLLPDTVRKPGLKACQRLPMTQSFHKMRLDTSQIVERLKCNRCNLNDQRMRQIFYRVLHKKVRIMPNSESTFFIVDFSMETPLLTITVLIPILVGLSILSPPVQ